MTQDAGKRTNAHGISTAQGHILIVADLRVGERPRSISLKPTIELRRTDQSDESADERPGHVPASG
ncbi:hypothetical protein ACIRD3_35535 [Kitasatospora sp. NPDC093550]|uniref:hypothetical protein n=1 Tax=Kitasatospora sp. NPDC093550 TaxID=3364089 RepID=UPI00381E31EF